VTSPFHLRRIRRRLALAALATFAVVLTVGLLGGALVNERRYHRGPRDRPTVVGPWGVVLAGLTVLAIGLVVAGVLLWRRISRPMADLLASAERVGTSATLDVPGPPLVAPVAAPPGTPRELRSLIDAFNAMTSRIERTERERRRFLADVTHELRTPLTVLRSGIEAQLDGVHERDDARLTALLDETVILARSIDDLHTLALHEAGRLTLRRAPTDLVALVRDGVASFTSSADLQRVTLRFDDAASPPIIADVDGGRIRQVLANALANAIRHAPLGGTVRVTVARVGPVVRVAVRDDGPGIAPGDLADVFVRYRKAADSGGSGLGLTIAKDLIEAHGGRIVARNNDDGAGVTGATISFELPAN